jgi:uncharacterized protein YjbJ (UPF0337 family)
MGLADKAKNEAQTVEGKAEEAVGRVTKDRSLEAEGRADRAAGNLKQAGEKVKDAVRPQR